MPRKDDERGISRAEALKTALIESVPIRRPADINVVVAMLQNRYYAPLLGYVPPLMLGNPDMPQVMKEALESDMITPADVPAVGFNREVVAFPGTVANFSAKLINPLLLDKNPIKGILSYNRCGYDNLDLTTFTTLGVQADLLSHGGQVVDTISVAYLMFLPRGDFRFRTSDVYDRYPKIGDKKPLYFLKGTIDAERWRKRIWEEKRRQDTSIGRAERLNQRGIIFPEGGGLPELGKGF